MTVRALHKTGRQRRLRGPPDPEPTLEAFAVKVARRAGFIPGTRQPRPGTEKLWQRYNLLRAFVEHHRTMRKPDLLKKLELTVSG